MEIGFLNFKCYEDDILRLNNGVTLIEGESGKGKSTIFEAVYYALYNAVKKPCTYNHNTCGVELRTENLLIRRYTGPCKLEVTVANDPTIYIGDVAQDIINHRYGTATEFLSTSYLKQNDRCVLLSAPDKVKLELLRSISLGDNNIKELHKKLDDYKQQISRESDRIDGCLQMIQCLITDFERQNQRLLDYIAVFNPANSVYPALQSCTPELFIAENNKLQGKQLKTEGKLLKLTNKSHVVTRLNDELTSRINDLKSISVPDIDIDAVNDGKSRLTMQRLAIEGEIAKHIEYAALYTAYSGRLLEAQELTRLAEIEHGRKIQTADAGWRQQIVDQELRFNQAEAEWTRDRQIKEQEYRAALSKEWLQFEATIVAKRNGLSSAYVLNKASKEELLAAKLSEIDGRIARITADLQSFENDKHRIMKDYATREASERNLYAVTYSFKQDKINGLRNEIQRVSEVVSVFETKKTQLANLMRELNLAELPSSEILTATIDRLNKNARCSNNAQATLQRLGYSTIADLTNAIVLLDSTIEKQSSHLKQLEESIQNKKWNDDQSKVLTCPKCKSGVYLENKILHEHSDNFIPVLKPVAIPEANQESANATNRKIGELISHKDRLNHEKSNLDKEVSSMVEPRDNDLSKLEKYRALVNTLDQIKQLNGDLDVQPAELARLKTDLIKLESDVETGRGQFELLVQSLKTEASNQTSQLVDKFNQELPTSLDRCLSEKAAIIDEHQQFAESAALKHNSDLEGLNGELLKFKAELSRKATAFSYMLPKPTKPIKPSRPVVDPLPEYKPEIFESAAPKESKANLDTHLANVTRNIETQDKLLSQHEHYQSYKATMTIGINALKAKLALHRSIDQYESAITKAKKSLAAVKTRMGHLSTVHDHYCKHLQREKLYGDKRGYESAKSNCNDESGRIKKLACIMKETERDMLNATVDHLNMEISRITDVLFPDDKIVVEFKTTKALKNKKKPDSLKCDIRIFYKNADVEMENLSGGERDRISLAMTLALNSVRGSGLIMLDESLHSISAEAKSNTVELLKRIVGDKMICAVISHDGINGEYDHVISL